MKQVAGHPKWTIVVAPLLGKIGHRLAAVVLVTMLLVGLWTLTGSGFFWPSWVLAGAAQLWLMTVMELPSTGDPPRCPSA